MLKAMGLREIDSKFDCESVEEAAELGLLALIRGISQDYWCAGWLRDIEFDLWSTIMDQPPRIEISEREKALLRLLSEECDGCWAWSGADGGPQFIPMAEWKEIARKRD